ncbi:glycoside hydrolase family 3 N-terminal domain-containing protein [Streptomyces sp. NPDC052236]|uniref:beta-xylosidase/alpha-l-arabinosidase n=1 Tax=Streptomyces sp. NPDC052236 TaxID=3365686 RepID=UPI0037CD8768
MTEALPQTVRESEAATDPWRDTTLPVADRVADLVDRMTLREKVAQLGAFWAAPPTTGDPVAPMPDDLGGTALTLGEVAKDGLGHLTRIFGTAPIGPAEGAARLREVQSEVARANRFAIPAIAHEECLTGFMTWKATVFPAPLAWGASFDPALVEEMATAVAASLRRAGVHQGLAPVLDVTRDYRWGRTEETIGEDPYLVGVIGAAYVRGLERSGVVATLKHFAGYASSRGGRNLAPAAVGPREFADIIIEPFAIALREGSPRSVMHSYADVDGVPAAADRRLLTGLLREELGFTGVVVADYFGVSFLETMHGVAGSRGEAAALALRAGVDVELPASRCYGEPLLDMVRTGAVPEELVDRAASRVLTLKCELGLLDGETRTARLRTGEENVTAPLSTGRESGTESGLDSGMDSGLDFDPPEHRRLARRLAEQSVVLLANDGVLPLAPDLGRIALTGPLADDARAMLGCYSFPNHMGSRHPEMSLGIEIPTLTQALADALPDAEITLAAGHDVLIADDADIAAAVAAARDAEVCVLALGDRAGLFGRGTSGEGCDAATLALPGRQAELAAAVLDTGTPTVIVVLSGRPYALGALADRAAAVVQAFLPGEEGGTALAGVLSGRVEPSGRLPVSVPRGPGGEPGTYLHSRLGGPHEWSSVDPTPAYAFGHGLTWTSFGYTDLAVDPAVATDGTARVTATVRNTGDRPGTEVVQLYLSDPVASVVRPVRWLAGWARVRLAPGEAARVAFTVHADRTSFTGQDMRRIVEPGTIEVSVGSSSADLPLRGSFVLEGPERTLGPERVMTVPVGIEHL